MVTWANEALCELPISLWCLRTHCSIHSSECKIDIRDTRAESLPTSEFVCLNGRICDLVSEAFGAMGKGNGNWTWLLCHGENRQTSVLHFTLQQRLLYGAGYIVVVFDAGFDIPECHIYHFQIGTQYYDVCTMQATHKHGFEEKFRFKGFTSVWCITQAFSVWCHHRNQWQMLEDVVRANF